jgi:recombinational DNA repair ATPase RecF
MRLISLTVRNYRLHRERTVEFDPSLNLIGGTNETGKSTLAEAIHRVLFMRHRAGGDLQSSMMSQIHAGPPEVLLSFETEGETWTIEKRFAGPQGTARLRSAGGISLQGDAAEERLSEITGNTEGVANRIKELMNRWSHLWVWQGMAGEDATRHAASRRDELVQRLQEQGLAAVMQSDADERIRQRFSAAYEELFNLNGSPKASSRLKRSNETLADANRDFERVTEQQQRLAAAVADQVNATTILKASTVTLPAQRKLLEATQASLAKVNDLQTRFDKEQLVLEAATQARTLVEKADQQIRDFQRQAVASREALVPAEAELSSVAGRESAARQQADSAELVHRQVGASLRLARQRYDLANACVIRFEKETTLQALTVKEGEVDVILEGLSSDRDALAKLPVISVHQLDELRQLESRLGKAESALNAIAAGIELVSSQQPVFLNDQPLEAGESRVITEMSEVSLSDGTRLRIQPGGGTSLATARRSLDDVRGVFASALDKLTVRSTSDAAEIVTSRQVIEHRISNTEAKLQALGFRELPEAVAAAAAALAQAVTEVELRHAAFLIDQNPPLVPSLQSAVQWQGETLEVLKSEEAKERALLEDADACRKAHVETLETLQTKRASLESGRRKLDELEQSARILEQNHGDATQRSAQLETAVSTETAAGNALHATGEALADLKPADLKRELTRLEGVVSNEERKQRDAENQLAVARNILALDGSTDPDAELIRAKARQALAAEEQAREKRHADAIALLHRLFSESQTAISESVTQPIADRVGDYLECLFGRGVRVDLDLNDANDTKIKLTRPGTPSFSFESLSGGAKEQVAAAVRLATAEILATNHQGSLPIVFDDAFAYADKERIEALQSMLYLASRRGLQVLVLTCTPGDYVGLGARETLLPIPVWDSMPAVPNSNRSIALSVSNEVASPSRESAEFNQGQLPDGNEEVRFLDALRAQGGSSGNQSLRNILGWEEGGYEQVKAQLIAKKMISTGRGRGGSVSLNSQDVSSFM